MKVLTIAGTKLGLTAGRKSIPVVGAKKDQQSGRKQIKVSRKEQT